MKRITVLTAVIVLFIGAAGAADITVSDQESWEDGDLTNLTAADGNVTLTDTDNETGTYTSEWLDFDAFVTFTDHIYNGATPNDTEIDWQFRISDDGTDGTTGAWESSIHDVDPAQYLQVRADLNADNNVTPWVTSYTVSAEETDAPEITVTSAPDHTSPGDQAVIEGVVDGDPHPPGHLFDVEYQHNDDGWVTACTGCDDFSVTVTPETGENTVDIRASDPQDRTDETSVTFRHADGSEIEFTVAVDRSFAGSSIPIRADSDVWPDDTDVGISYFLEQGSDRYNISDKYDGGICNLSGHEAWNLGDGVYCGTSVPEDIPDDTTYELTAEWYLGGDRHHEVIDDDFLIDDDYIWTDIDTTHGGMMDESVVAQRGFSQDYSGSSGNYVTSVGSSFQIEKVNLVTAVCSNGVVREERTPALAGFVYDEDGRIGTTHNNMFDDPDCRIHDDVTRTNLHESTRGYLPDSCDLGWRFGGDLSFNVHQFDDTGEYTVNMDYINAISDSPDYICPGDDSSPLCDYLEMSGNHHGWESLHDSSINVVDPEAEAEFAGYSPNVVAYPDHDAIRRDNYTGDIRIDVDVENIGVGGIEIQDADIDCPAGVSCDPMTSTPITVSEGDQATVRMNVEIPDGERVEGDIDVSVEYTDAYGLDDVPVEVFEHSVMLDEVPPTTTDNGPEGWQSEEQTVDLNCADDGVGCDTTYYCIGEECDDFSTFNPGIDIDESGNHTLRYYSTDHVENAEDVQETYVLVDMDPPNIDCDECDYPEPAIVGEEVTFAPNVTDPYSGVDHVHICEEEDCESLYCEYPGSEETCSYETTFPYGAKEYCIHARDNVGNTNTLCGNAINVKGGVGDPCDDHQECAIGVCEGGACVSDELLPPELRFD